MDAPPQRRTELRVDQALPFRTDLEGMRAVAVVLVVAYHAGIPLISGGYVGVDVFFVLSGFLITNHLLSELSRTGSVRVLRFYARRARRLLPAALVVILVTVVVVALVAPPRLVPPVMDDSRASLVFVPNLLFADRATDYLAEDSPSPLLHFWSLGVEEQFYIVWPILLLLLWSITRRAPHLLVPVLGLLVVASFGASVLVTNYNEPWGFFAPWTRAWELGTGALIAALGLHARRIPELLAAFLAWAGLLLIVGSAVMYSDQTVFPGAAAAVPVLGAAAVIVGAQSAGRLGPGGMLSRRPMQFTGRISYSLYLVHWPLLVLPVIGSAMGEPLPLSQSVALAVLAVPVAWALHRGIERPILRSTIVDTPGPRVVLVGSAAAIILSIVAVLGVETAVAARPLATATVAGPPPATESWPLYSEIVPADLRPALADAPADLPSIYSTGCHLGLDATEPTDCTFGDVQAGEVVVLFGDSHAAQWFPAIEAIATSRGLRLESHTKSSCPPFDVEIVTNGVVDTGCAEWREQVIRLLEQSQPDTVVISAFAHYAEFGSRVAVGDRWTEAVKRLVHRLSAGSKVVVIADTPRFPRTPALCLSANVGDASICDFPRERAINEPFAQEQRAAVESAGGQPVDMNDFLCDVDRCGSVMGNLLLYRDQHHIATRVALTLADDLESAIYSPR